MPDVGCEIVATYNALRLNGRQISISNIIRSFEKDGYLMSEAYFGSDPYAIGDYLDSIYVNYTEYANNSSYTNFKNAVTNNISSKNTYIVSYWNTDSLLGGLHTVAFSTNGGTIYIYNLHTGDTKVSTRTSLSQFVESDRFIAGYALVAKAEILG